MSKRGIINLLEENLKLEFKYKKQIKELEKKLKDANLNNDFFKDPNFGDKSQIQDQIDSLKHSMKHINDEIRKLYSIEGLTTESKESRYLSEKAYIEHEIKNIDTTVEHINTEIEEAKQRQIRIKKDIALKPSNFLRTTLITGISAGLIVGGIFIFTSLKSSSIKNQNPTVASSNKISIENKKANDEETFEPDNTRTYLKGETEMVFQKINAYRTDNGLKPFKSYEYMSNINKYNKLNLLGFWASSYDLNGLLEDKQLFKDLKAWDVDEISLVVVKRLDDGDYEIEVGHTLDSKQK